MEQDEWTPARGWMIVLGKAGMRAGILLVGLTGFLYIAWPVIFEIMNSLLFWAIPLVIFESVVGFMLGHAVVRNLKEDSQFEGRLLLLPMLVMVTAAEVGACYLAAALRGISPAMLIVPLCVMILWGWVACFAKLILV